MQWKSVIHLALDQILLSIIYLISESPRVLPANKLGFYCNDPNLSFKYRRSMVSSVVILPLVLFAPLFVFLIVEYICHRKSNIKNPGPITKALKLYKSYWTFYFIQSIAGNLLKSFVGAPRPNFFETCQPNVPKNCTGYIYDYECTNPSKFLQADSHKSFPSGHTFLTTSAAIILIYYLEKRLGHVKPRLPVIMVQLFLYGIAVITSVSRVLDHHHHWWDVLAGVVIGIIFSFLAIVRLFNKFETETDREVVATCEA